MLSGIPSHARQVGSRRGRDVYVLGAANVGKSMFIGSMLECMHGGKPRRLPISSSTPGETAGIEPSHVTPSCDPITWHHHVKPSRDPIT